mmetsp:Transcript_56523/g.132555  ORF Transcript_56523/g.132555 Transcript_56523/m.132555 type:complete len:201 (-) Transcript_56523:953-1555(-)
MSFPPNQTSTVSGSLSGSSILLNLFAVTKKRGPSIWYCFLSSSSDTTTSNCLPACHANAMEHIATPAPTAYAMLVAFANTVTITITKTSHLGTFLCSCHFALYFFGKSAATNMVRENHLKVCKTTTIITPASAATGIKFSSGYAPMQQIAIPKAATIGPKRPLPPLRQFTVDRPIIALPPMPPRNPEMMLPTPIAKTVRL